MLLVDAVAPLLSEGAPFVGSGAIPQIAPPGIRMAKTIRYRMTQGQAGIRPSGGGIDLDTVLQGSQPNTVAFANFPIEVEFDRLPLLFPADASVSTLSDVNATQDPAYKYVVQETSITFNAAFAANANSFSVLIRVWRAGVLVGTLDTFDASVTTFAAHTTVTHVAGFGITQLQAGDIVTYRIVINGTGAACPPFLITLDGQV